MIAQIPVIYVSKNEDSSDMVNTCFLKTVQVMPFQVTGIEYLRSKEQYKHGLGVFDKYKIYDVLAMDSERFLVVDDNKNFIWIGFGDCKAA